MKIQTKSKYTWGAVNLAPTGLRRNSSSACLWGALVLNTLTFCQDFPNSVTESILQEKESRGKWETETHQSFLYGLVKHQALWTEIGNTKAPHPSCIRGFSDTESQSTCHKLELCLCKEVQGAVVHGTTSSSDQWAALRSLPLHNYCARYNCCLCNTVLVAPTIKGVNIVHTSELVFQNHQFRSILHKCPSRMWVGMSVSWFEFLAAVMLFTWSGVLMLKKKNKIVIWVQYNFDYRSVTHSVHLLSVSLQCLLDSVTGAE